MKELEQVITNFYKDRLKDEICSKVEGRRNWIIITSKDGIIFCGGYGEANRKGLLCWNICKMAEKEINFFKYTYKQDYLKDLEKIKKYLDK